MINFPEQLTAARKSQFEAQLNFFNSFTSKAVASTEKLVALNLNLTREAIEKSSATVCQALTVREPADLFALTARTPEAISTLVAYSRDLMAIATGAITAQPIQSAPAARTAQAVPFTAPAPAPVETVASSAAPVGAAAEAVQESAFAAEAASDAVATQIAKAVAEVGVKNGAARPVAASFPAVDSVNVQVTGIAPVDATPPPAPAAGTPEVVQQDAPGTKGRKKK